MTKHIHYPLPGHGSIAPRRAVLHDTEGITRAEDLGPFFARVEVDVHRGIDAQGDESSMVRDSEKAWHCAGYNGTSLGIEQCVRSGAADNFTANDWVHGFHHGLLTVAARLSHWSSEHGFPLAHSVEHGVCTHADLGAVGGGHHDPGHNYPMKYVLCLARIHYYRERGWNLAHRHPRRFKRFLRYKRYCHAVQRRHGVRPQTKQ